MQHWLDPAFQRGSISAGVLFRAMFLACKPESVIEFYTNGEPVSKSFIVVQGVIFQLNVFPRHHFKGKFLQTLNYVHFFISSAE